MWKLKEEKIFFLLYGINNARNTAEFSDQGRRIRREWFIPDPDPHRTDSIIEQGCVN